MDNKLSRFPFPTLREKYRFSNNSVPLEPPYSIEATEEYEEEIRLKRTLLTDHPSRCYQSYPHTLEAQWEALALILTHLAEAYPQDFECTRSGDQWTFTNHKLKERRQFTYGDPHSLPHEPLDFVGRQVQEDLFLMMQRDGDLYLDAGQLCFPGNWSLEFNAGMTFVEIHSPIPRFTDDDLNVKIRNFIMRMDAGQAWTRRGWSINAGRHLDSSAETFHIWGQDKTKVTDDNAGDMIHFRVEVQKLFRLPLSHTILFTIHTHLISLRELGGNLEWANQLHQVLSEVPDYIADYKGWTLYKNNAIRYLQDVIGKAR